MIYFKTIAFPDDLTQDKMETALRKSAIKKTTILDFKSATIDVGRNKDFLGYENNKSLSFTRTKTSLEFLLPKIIISLSKDNQATNYRIRLSAIPFMFCLLLGMGVLVTFIGLLKGIVLFGQLSPLFIAGILFFLLLMLELKITNKKVANCLKNI